MCGICGGAAPAESVAAATAALAHRGPDADGLADFGPVVLGHRRLAVVDLDARSDQPFTYGSVTVAYNGECWNYRQLRAELEAAGCSFTTAGDTEVVAAALDAWGSDALPRLNGMFALAWWDGGALWLARDRYGEVPLHWGQVRPGVAVFASELKALAALGAAPASVRMVEPATAVRVWPDYHAERYDTIDVGPIDDDRDAATPVVRRLLTDAVAERAMADVPVGCLVSGGIDSSAIAYLAAEHFPDLRCYTAVYDRKALDLRCARLLCDHLGLKLVEVEVPAPSAEDLAATVRHIEMPSKAQTEIAWPCLFLARAMRDDGIKVAFSGEGSDELWASYNRAFHEAARSPVSWNEFRRDTFLGQHRKNFARCNKVFMAHSVECRLPFLHPPLVNYGLRLRREAVYGPHYRHNPGAQRDPSAPAPLTKEKWVLRGGFADVLPERIVRRDKEAFQIAGGFRDAAAEAVAEPLRFYKAEYDRAFPGVRW